MIIYSTLMVPAVILEESFLHEACKALGTDVAAFKKKVDMTRCTAPGNATSPA